MNEERKEYSIVGQVTIGTDEYRDLIEECKILDTIFLLTQKFCRGSFYD